MRRRGRRVHADDLTGAVDERTAGVPRVDRRLGLQEPAQRLGSCAVVPTGCDGPSFSGDDALGDRGRALRKSERVPNRENVLSHLDRRGITERDRPKRGRPVHLEKCDVVAGVRAEKGCRVRRLLAVERDSYLSCVRYDVIVGQDLAARG